LQDVLTMSKLDSGLLIMTPVDAQPEAIARHAVKMFEGEAKAAGISLKFSLEDSCREIIVDRVSLDPTRLLQVLIVRAPAPRSTSQTNSSKNLITNAIKFTRLEKMRKVSVSMGGSLERPLHSAHGQVQYVRVLDAAEAQPLQADWGKGEVVSFFRHSCEAYRH
jgi:signal transduction histidine kinase